MKFLSTPTDTIAVIDGALPDAGEWVRIARDRILVNVVSMPAQARSLAALVPFAQHISRLAINSSTCTDLREVSSIPGLKWLLVGGKVTQPPSASTLTSLEYFAGDPALLPGIVSLPTITRLKVKWYPGIGDAMSEMIADLTLTEARALTDLDELANLRRLKNLTVHGSERLSLRGLGNFQSLASLTLHSVKLVEDSVDVLQANQLSRVTLEDCPSIDQLEALMGFRGDIIVIGRNPFTAELRAAARPGWSFPPIRR